MEPEEINIIVHSCKGLHVRKKGKSRFSVIFGVGSNKFRTAFVEDALGSAVWNEESSVSVDSTQHPLLLVVTDKDHVLGQVSVPLETIALSRQKYDAPLRPHKKNNTPQGELSFSCWVSKYATLSPAITVDQAQEQKLSKTSSLSKLFTSSPLFKRKDRSKHNESQFGNKKYSLSMLDVKHPAMDKMNVSGETKGKGHFFSHVDLTADRNSPRSRAKSSPKIDSDFSRFPPNTRAQSSPRIDNDFQRPRSNSQESSTSSSSGFISHVDPTESGDRISQGSTAEVGAKDAHLCLTKVPEETGAPEVTGISPKEGATCGLTRLTIRGSNLGVNTPDVVGLYICGSNCLSTLEYVSPNKLHCTTKAWRPGSGDIIIVTQSGGRGKCSVQFTFVEPPRVQEPDSPQSKPAASQLTPSPALSAESSPALPLSQRYGRRVHAQQGATPTSSPPATRKSNPQITVQGATSSEPSGLLARLSGSKAVDIKEDDPSNEDSTPPAFRKRGSIRDTSIRYSKETLMTEIKRLRDENKSLKDQNEAMTRYIDRLVSKVILQCPELLSVDM